MVDTSSAFRMKAVSQAQPDQAEEQAPVAAPVSMPAAIPGADTANPAPATPAPKIDLSKQSNDDLLGKIDLSTQTNDQLLGAEPSGWQSFKGAVPYFLGGGGVSGDTARDQFFNGTAAGRVLEALGQGFSQGWGSEPVGMSDETRKWLRDTGIISNTDKSPWAQPFKAFNESFLRVGATAWDLASRTPGALIASGALGASQGAQELGASPTFGNELEKTLNLLPFALGDVAVNTPHVGEVPVSAGETATVATEAKAPEATPVSPAIEAPTSVESAAIRTDLANKEENPTTPAEEPAQAQPQPQAQPKTLDDYAKQQNPALMDQWKSLMVRRDSYRQWINDLNAQREAYAEANSPYKPQIEQTQGQISDLQARMGDATPRLAKKYQARIDDLQQQQTELQQAHDEHVQQVMAKDSPDVARVRQALMQNDYRMRDMAVDVSHAYKDARAAMEAEQPTVAPVEAQEAQTPVAEAETPVVAENAPVEAPEAEATPAEAAAQPETEAETPAEAPIEAPVEQEAPKTEEVEPVDHIAKITDDITQKLVKVGRSEEEAKTVAPIIAAHYEARASRFENKSPMEIYDKEAPEIKTGRATTKRGTAKLVEGERPVIRLMQDADASTFMHETGHVWLHELMQDAATEGVHQSVKDDAQAVRDWLGNDGGDITRAQHEKFARSFEDYLYTGDAPSSRLAAIFEKVRGWLASLYDASKRTAIVIPDNIKDVFDRLIEANPERQERKPEANNPFGKELADLHEVDAEHSPGEIAAEVGHNIEAEMGMTARERPPLGEDIGEGRSGRPGEGTPDTGEPRGAGEEPGSLGLGGARNTPASSEIGGGAREGQNEGAGSREGATATEGEREGGETATLTRPTVKTEVPPNPNDNFAPSPKPEKYFDKAGNIKLDNLNRPEDIKSVLRIAAIENNDFMAERSGVMPLVEQQAAADALGLTPENFVPNRPIDISESTWLRAVKDLTLRSATDVRDLMQRVKDTKSDADAASLGKALARHNMIQGEFSRAKAESGRALAANRWDDAKAMVEGVGRMAEQATGMTLNQLKKFAEDGSALDTPAKISKYIQDSFQPTMRDKIQYVALNGLISGPITHMTYLAANMLNAIGEAAVERPLAAAYGTARDIIKGEPTEGRVYWGEAKAAAYGMFRGARDGVRAAAQAWHDSMTTPLPGEDINEFYFKHYRPNPLGGTLGTVVGVPGRVVSALDAFSRNVFYSMNIAEQAVRAANDAKLTGDDLAQKTAQLTKSPSPEMMKQAVDFATSMAYMKKPEFGSAMYHIERFANSNLATKMMLPFVRTGANIIDKAFVERTPVGLLSSQIRDDLLGRNGPAAADFARSRMTTGLLIGGALTGLAMEGLATGAGPTDSDKRRLWLVEHQPYSIRIGDTWVQYKRLGHLGLIMGMGANFAETIHALDDKGAEAAVLQLAHGIATDVVDESWMAGLKNVLDVVDDPERAKTVPFSFASELIPFSSLMRQSANVLDPYMRQANDMGDRLQNMIPVWRQGLMPKRDAWGDPVQSSQSPLAALAMSPFQDTIHDDPINAELERLGVAPGVVDKKISGVDLTPQQYDDYQRVSGRLKKAAVQSVMRSPGWSTLPDVVKVNTLHHLFEGVNKSARGAILMQYPAIIQQAMEAKRAKLGG